MTVPVPLASIGEAIVIRMVINVKYMLLLFMELIFISIKCQTSNIPFQEIFSHVPRPAIQKTDPLSTM